MQVWLHHQIWMQCEWSPSEDVLNDDCAFVRTQGKVLVMATVQMTTIGALYVEFRVHNSFDSNEYNLYMYMYICVCVD